MPDHHALTVGSGAPDFSLPALLPDGDERIVSLHELRGAPVVLVFYPADHSPVCTAQLTNYTTDIARFAELDARVLALSPQTVEQHRAFAEAQGGFAFPLLADVDKRVGGAYQVLGPLGFYRRCVFVLDASATVRWLHRATAGLTYRPVDEIVDAIAAARDAA